MKKIFTNLFLLATLFLTSTNLSAQTYNGGTWYSLYQSDGGSIWTINSLTYDAFAPIGGNLTFNWTYSGTLFKKHETKIFESSDGGTKYVEKGSVSGTSSGVGNISISTNINKIKFDRATGNTNTVKQ